MGDSTSAAEPVALKAVVYGEAVVSRFNALQTDSDSVKCDILCEIISAFVTDDILRLHFAEQPDVFPVGAKTTSCVQGGRYRPVLHTVALVDGPVVGVTSTLHHVEWILKTCAVTPSTASHCVLLTVAK